MRRSGISDEREARLDIRWQFTKITRRHSPILVRALSLLSLGLTSCPSYWQNMSHTWLCPIDKILKCPSQSGLAATALVSTSRRTWSDGRLSSAWPSLPPPSLPPPSLPYWHEIDIYQATTWLYIQALTVDTISHPVTALYGQLNRMRVSKLSFHFKV